VKALPTVDAFLAELERQGRSPATLTLYRWALARFAAWAHDTTDEPWSPALVDEYLAWCQRAGAEFDRRGRQRGPAASAHTVAAVVLRYLTWAGGHRPAAGSGPAHDGLERFAAWLLSRGKSPKSVRVYRLAVHTFHAWFETSEHRPFVPSAWTGEDVLRFRSHLTMERRQRPGGVNTYLTGLQVYARFLRSIGDLAFDPFDAIDELTLPRPPAQPRWLEPDEQRALVREITVAAERGRGRQALRDLAMVLVMLDGGLREEQVVRLRPADVILSPRAQARIVVLYGKHGRSYDVPIESARLYEALRKYNMGERPERPFFFRSQRAEALTTRGIRLLVRRWGDRAGVPGVTPHRLRHSFGRNLHRAGVPLDQIARLLGQLRKDGAPNLASVAIYTAASEADLRSALRLAGGG
jgi:site-specific recombinase XerD